MFNKKIKLSFIGLIALIMIHVQMASAQTGDLNKLLDLTDLFTTLQYLAIVFGFIFLVAILILKLIKAENSPLSKVFFKGRKL